MANKDEKKTQAPRTAARELRRTPKLHPEFKDHGAGKLKARTAYVKFGNRPD